MFNLYKALGQNLNTEYIIYTQNRGGAQWSHWRWFEMK